jgi:hypothetical protein
MTNTLIVMTEDQFDATYTLVTNHLNPHATWMLGDGPGCLFETYGEEIAFVRQQNPLTVWTLVDGDDGNQYVLNGCHLVNRVGYLISSIPFPAESDIQVPILFHSDE